jgi:hypothetical protein
VDIETYGGHFKKRGNNAGDEPNQCTLYVKKKSVYEIPAYPLCSQ